MRNIISSTQYSNIRVILDTNIHSYDICIVLCHTNIFRYSFVLFSRYKYVWIFVCIEIDTNVALWYTHGIIFGKLRNENVLRELFGKGVKNLVVKMCAHQDEGGCSSKGEEEGVHVVKPSPGSKKLFTKQSPLLFIG